MRAPSQVAHIQHTHTHAHPHRLINQVDTTSWEHICLYTHSDTHWWLSWRFTVAVKGSCKRVVGAARFGSIGFINRHTHTYRHTHGEAQADIKWPLQGIHSFLCPLSPHGCLFVFRPIRLAAFQDSIHFLGSLSALRTVLLTGFPWRRDGPAEIAFKNKTVKHCLKTTFTITYECG